MPDQRRARQPKKTVTPSRVPSKLPPQGGANLKQDAKMGIQYTSHARKRMQKFSPFAAQRNALHFLTGKISKMEFLENMKRRNIPEKDVEKALLSAEPKNSPGNRFRFIHQELVVITTLKQAPFNVITVYRRDIGNNPNYYLLQAQKCWYRGNSAYSDFLDHSTRSIRSHDAHAIRVIEEGTRKTKRWL